jgi:hypothetical protein
MAVSPDVMIANSGVKTKEVEIPPKSLTSWRSLREHGKCAGSNV